MTLPNRPRYAARLNAFKTKGGTVAEMIRGAGQVGGLTSADLNYPDHFAVHDPGQLSRLLADEGMAVNGLAMRYYAEEAFRKNLPEGEAFGFLPKPFSLKQLIETVKDHLAG